MIVIPGWRNPSADGLLTPGYRSASWRNPYGVLGNCKILLLINPIKPVYGLAFLQTCFCAKHPIFKLSHYRIITLSHSRILKSPFLPVAFSHILFILYTDVATTWLLFHRLPFTTKIPLLRSFVIHEIFGLTPALSKGGGDYP